jgi:hypothetical protein
MPINLASPGGARVIISPSLGCPAGSSAPPRAAGGCSLTGTLSRPAHWLSRSGRPPPTRNSRSQLGPGVVSRWPNSLAISSRFAGMFLALEQEKGPPEKRPQRVKVFPRLGAHAGKVGCRRFGSPSATACYIRPDFGGARPRRAHQGRQARLHRVEQQHAGLSGVARPSPNAWRRSQCRVSLP